MGALPLDATRLCLAVLVGLWLGHDALADFDRADHARLIVHPARWMLRGPAAACRSSRTGRRSRALALSRNLSATPDT